MFSSRTNWPKTLNPLAAALNERRGRGLPVLDLTEANPTRAGFNYDPDAILEALAHPNAMRYEPDPRGLPVAREAIARYYARSGVSIATGQIILASGTSEAYSHAMRLVAEPGDEILCPSPSYPLFDFLADINDARLLHYPLFYDHGWRIDLDRLEKLVTDRSRALIVVHPNNPTGSYLQPRELEALVDLARRRELILVVDEVFRDYAWNAGHSHGDLKPLVSTAGVDGCLVLTLNGLSKLSALPQVKLAWTVVSGPQPLREEALARLEVIADTYLSVGTPVQHAAASLLELGDPLRRQILARITQNVSFLDAALGRGTSISRLEAEGGWYVILRIPSTRGDEEWAIELLRTDGVYVHPGHFFGLPPAGYLVVSAITDPELFRAGIGSILHHAAASA